MNARTDRRAVDQLRRRLAERAPQPPRPSTLRDSLPDPGPPAEVVDALWPLPAGGPWEGGTTDHTGRRWEHVPWRGWQPARAVRSCPYRPTPYTTSRGRVYTSRDVRRARRRELWVRRLAAPALVVAAAMVCNGLLELALLWAAGGLALATVVFVLAWPRRPR